MGTMKLQTLSQAELAEKTVLLRLDLNVPIDNGVIQDDTRIDAALPTIHRLLDENCRIVIVSHLGRPKGVFSQEHSLEPIQKALASKLDMNIALAPSCLSSDVLPLLEKTQAGGILLLENLRFHPEEKQNDAAFAKELASYADLFVDDGFGVVHRAHASTVGVAKLLPSYAGLLVEKEFTVLSELLTQASRPFCLIVGGAKIDTKIGILEAFIDKADSFLIGGALANTFLAAQGKAVGKSLYQEDKLSLAKEFLDRAKAAGKTVLLPSDVLTAKEINSEAQAECYDADAVPDDQIILDLGPESRTAYAQEVSKANTVVWNGPMGFYELSQFETGSKVLAQSIASSDAMSVVGGGDSIDAIKNFQLDEESFSHISTGGGAMLEFLEGKELPGLKVLMQD
jgi:phosphoglycerate kinase